MQKIAISNAWQAEEEAGGILSGLWISADNAYDLALDGSQ